MSPVQRPSRDEIHIFASASAFGAWLHEHHASTDALFVGFYRKGAGRSAMTYPEAVDEALCYGWIDGITYRIDDEVRATRFTPRRRTSGWSAVNIAKMARLAAEGRLHASGIRAFEDRDRRKDQSYSYERPAQELPEEWRARLRANADAWRHWQSETPSYRRTVTHWVLSAKRTETRERRMATLIADSAAGRRVGPMLVGRLDARATALYPEAMTVTPAGVEVTHRADHGEAILTPEALAFVADLHRTFEDRRQALLRSREERQARFDAGELPDFLAETAAIRDDPSWHVAPAPADFDDRRVEITGPAEPKMMINALNSGARVFMADFEDALSPTWANVVTGQWAVREAVRRRLRLETSEKTYELDPQTATLVIRPRGWHLPEAHLHVDGRPVSASLFDFGLTFFHNAREQLDRGSGPYFYLPKLQSHLEARLWNDVFVHAQERQGIPRGSIRATVLVEHVLLAFEMEEVLWELREHAAGLNAGRWDYIFSLIKTFRSRPDFVLPDRAQVTMTVPFMRAYTELLVATCHRRGAHAMGGMAAFIPSRRDPDVNERAMDAVRADKQRESSDGFDGTWVAHPDLVPLATAVFDAVLAARPNQKERPTPEVNVVAGDLLDLSVPGGDVTEGGVRGNVSVGLAYLASWLAGNGAAAINNLMEDAATAEISRSQLWQWRAHGVPLDGGKSLTADRYAAIRDEELATLRERSPDAPWADATALLDDLVLADDYAEFLTLPAYRRLQTANR